MKPRMMLLSIVGLLLCAASLNAQCYRSGYCAPYRGVGYNYGSHYQHSYQRSYQQSYPIYGPWQWAGWSTDPVYFTRGQWISYSSYDRRWVNDGWLYSRSHGIYDKHCLISEYSAKLRAIYVEPRAVIEVFGDARYGFDPQRYAVAKAYGPKVAGVLRQQDVPSPIDVASLLPPYATERSARQDHVARHAESATEALKTVALGEQENERLDNEARRQIAISAQQMQGFERMLGQFKEFAAVNAQQATVSGASTPVAVDDPALAQYISTSCMQCHSGGKVEGGVDFGQAGSFTAADWKVVRNSVISGKMPKGGARASDEVSDLFDEQYQTARSSE